MWTPLNQHWLNQWFNLCRLSVAFFICTLSLTIIPSDLPAQQLFVNKSAIVQELDKRGLEYNEVKDALLLQGIDIENLQPESLTPEQVKQIEDTILALTKNKQQEEQAASETTLKAEPVEESRDTVIPDKAILKTEPLEQAKFEEEVFGQGLFRNKVVEVYQKSNELNAPDSYILGPGDEVIVSIWGRSQLDQSYVIESNGFITIANGSQRVYLRGLSLADARRKLRRFFSQIYSFGSGEFNVALNYSRTVKISIYGEVGQNPGSYSISAFNSAFNALALVKGTNDIGSLRKIQLQKASGETMVMDVYELLRDPAIQNNYFLEENDVILVPVADNIVTVEGGVKRPLKYEMVNGEGLTELFDFCGGFTENAYPEKVQIKRFVDGQQTITDLDWEAYKRDEKNFLLENGDVVIVSTLDESFRNFVEVTGEVLNPGIYERTPGMTIRALIEKAGLKITSSTEIAYLTRTAPNGLSEIVKVDLNSILTQSESLSNLTLKDSDLLEIWSQERFNDAMQFSVSGAVRQAGQWPYDNSNNIRVVDAIQMAGGLTRDASNFAIIHRNDPLNPKAKSYKTIDNLDELFANPGSTSNFIMSPFDSLVVESKNTFQEEAYVRIEGAVNRPGEFQYGESMTIKDLLTLAGGFKLAASTNNIEISRVIIQNNEPTRTVVEKLQLDRTFNLVNGDGPEYELEPFDNVAVRFVNDFELQQRVFLTGEVKYPGPYAISIDNERISSVIRRAGGLTDEAFPPGATLEREEGDYGSVVIKLDDILKNSNSEFNFVVKNGDIINVPKVKEFVTIRGATKVQEVVGEDAINAGNEIHVPFHEGKDAMFYINEYAGGLSDLADKQKVFVKYANGEIKKPKNGFFKKRYPKVEQGSEISVGYKAIKPEEETTTSDVDWTKVLGDSVAQAMSILTLILLIQRLD